MSFVNFKIAYAYTMISHLKKDTLLKTVLDTVVLPEGRRVDDLYLTILESIVSQQLSIKAADTIFKRFLQLFENQYPLPEVLIHMEAQVLRKVGLSSQKSGYLQNVAHFHMSKGLSLDIIDAMSDEEVIAYLTQIKGVGRWTAEMLLMFALQRQDIMPVDDLGIQQAMSRLYDIDAKGNALKKKMLEIAEVWRPYRTVACKYLWKWKDQSKVREG
ncbi:MAG TPA: DNA-3-methyladenine glycosylase [Cytophagales bacterium]|nr:DNA-3-methyladenine glycosylase [Cytophagales bacterium]